MELTRQKLIYFSPTQTTQKVLAAVAEGTGISQTEQIDLTLPQAETLGKPEIHQELAIIGAPVYSGRVALEAANRLQQIKGNGSPAVIVVVYGNRAFEDALIELRDIATEAGFIPIAAAAFIGEHSFATADKPVANGRPDTDDLSAARGFGVDVQKKLGQLQTLDSGAPLQVPGSTPYKDRKPGGGVSPNTLEETCTLCGTCADVCPTGAITVGETVVTDKGRCIICCACIKSCPSGARVMEEPVMLKITDWLHTEFSARSEPEIFI